MNDDGNLPGTRSTRKTILIMCLLSLGGPIPLLTEHVIDQTTTAIRTTTEFSTSTIAIATSYATSSTNATALRFSRTPDDFNNQTSKFTLGQSEETFEPVTMTALQPFEPRVCLYYDYFVFKAPSSQRIRAHFETTFPVTFYVMNLDQLLSYQGYYCGSGYPRSQLSVVASSYDLDWTAPQAGVYAFLFASPAPYGARNILHFTAYSYVTTVENATSTYSAFRTTSTEILETIRSTLLSMSRSGYSAGSSYLVALFAVVVALAAVLVGNIKRARRRQ